MLMKNGLLNARKICSHLIKCRDISFFSPNKNKKCTQAHTDMAFTQKTQNGRHFVAGQKDLFEFGAHGDLFSWFCILILTRSVVVLFLSISFSMGATRWANN